MTSEKGGKKEKNQNIQVFVRLRPLNQRERDIKSLGVVEVVNNREVVVRQSQQTSLTKKFTFDRAFGPAAKQVEIYQDVVSPLIEEVLSGYNCTVFAYGQTGTGKTHTMVGEHSSNDSTWQSDPLAGIIPRALSQLFDELRITNTEYTVRVSYLELYNEELFDLLSTSEDNSKLRIYEDVSRKGSNIVNGLEEITVYNKNEVYKIMAQGQERKRVASTLMNAQSSRSHTVFTIVVHMKENSSEGEEMMKIGKLNLVDLAGSENISKAGSDNPAKKERARECVNINQSLLTLGRVITALVERHPHIPYRESKLTRILQESLGGRTKTSIIATISPGHKDLEETMSTLEYAHRAKNIQNKPEVNQKLTKKAILKEFSEEIDRLKRDLQATRDKNGVYLASETYAELTLKDEEQRKEIQELLLQKRAMEDERDRMVAIFAELEEQLKVKRSELDAAQNQLGTTRVKLANTNNMLRTTKIQFEEQKHLVSAHQGTETKLGAQAKQLVQVADTASSHAAALHDNLDKRRNLELCNLEVTRGYRAQSSEQRTHIAGRVQRYTEILLTALDQLRSTLDEFTSSSTVIHEEQKSNLKEIIDGLSDTMTQIKSLTRSMNERLNSWRGEQQSKLNTAVSEHSSAVNEALSVFLHALGESVQKAASVLARDDITNFLQQWYSGASARVVSLQRAHASFVSRARAGHERRRGGARGAAGARRAHAARHHLALRARVQEMENKIAQRESRVQRIIDEAKEERQRGVERILNYMEMERKLLEERLARYYAEETKVLDETLANRLKDAEEEMSLIAEHKSQVAEFKDTCDKVKEEEVSQADIDMDNFEAETQESEQDLTKYNKDFDEGASAVSVDMEVLTQSVASLASHVSGELTELLGNTQQLAQEESNKLISSDKTNVEQFLGTMDAMLQEVITSNHQYTEEFINNLEAHSSNTISGLTSLGASIAQAVSSWQDLTHNQTSTIQTFEQQARELNDDVADAVQVYHQLEDKYLAEDYRLYSPTGRTPARTDYRYPRSLAATSPHERILARFRASRQDLHDDDCVVIESDSEGRGASDSESVVSEDGRSAAACTPAHAHTPAILKSTSETDIYQRRKQEQAGKENADRSLCYKKPSKLPALTSIKKPLIERNLN